MAQVKTNAIVRGLSGKFGDQIVFRHLRDGRTIMCARPDFSRRKLSKDQKKHHEKFKAAAAYARTASLSQPIYAELAAGTMKNAYNVALGDWFHPPVIHHIEKRDGKIIIQASDDVCVASVVVMVLDEEGKVIEKGEGIRGKGDLWEYTQTASRKVIVDVQDLPGIRVWAVVA